MTSKSIYIGISKRQKILWRDLLYVIRHQDLQATRQIHDSKYYLQTEGLKFRRRQHEAKNTKSATAQQLQEIKSKRSHRKRALSLKPTETYYSKQSKCNIIRSSSWQYCYLNHTDPCKIHLGAFVDHRLNQLPICNNRNSQLKVDV